MANYNQPFQQPVEEEEVDETFSFVTQQPVAKKEEDFDETFSFVTQPSIQVQPEEEFDETFAFAAGEPSTVQPQPSSPRKLSQRELYADPEFQRVLEFYMRKVGSNEDFFEHMRDAEWNLGSAAMRAYQSGSWDDETKAAYSYLRDRFHNTKLQGAQEWFQFFKNAGADVLTDPANFAALLFAIPSFGTSAAIRTAAGAASKQALSRFTTAGLSKKTIEELAGKLPKSLIGPARKEMAKRTALYGAVEGGAWTGLYDYLAQSTDINIDPTKDEIDWGQVGLSTALGATIVGGIGAGMGAISGRKYLQKEFDFSNEAAILRARDDQVRLGKVDADTTNLLNANAKFGAADPTTTPKWKLAQRFLGATIGKSTTPFKGPAQGSQTLQELLSKLRYDWDWTLTGAKRAGETLATFGEDLGRRQGSYLFRLERSLNELYREGWFANLSQKDNKHLITLLRNKNTKEIDGKKVSPEVRKAAAQIRPILDALFKEGKDLKLFSEFQQITDYVPRRFQYDKVKNGQKKLRALVIKYGLADPITEADKITFQTKKEKGILASGKEVEVVLKEQGNVDQEVFGEAANEWLEAWTKGDKVLARELKAKKIVDDMIEARWTPHELNTGQTGQGYGFLRTRPFHAIPDEELAEFLENDVEKLLKDYIINASAAITRTKFFGKTRKSFETNYMKPIREELEASGMVDDEIGKVVAALRNMHGKVTGTDHLFIKNKYARHGMEWTKLSQQMAHLPLATLSSVTEPLILLSRVGIEDVPYAVGQIGNALVKETAKMFDRTARGLRRGVLRQKVKGRGKDLNQEEWLDLYQTGLALEQATMERIEGMFGTSFHGRHARGLQNFFFKSNLLTQWTSAVQLASFTTGKRLIRSNAKKLFENQHGTKLISRTKQKYYEEQLRDLGLNVDETISWYRRSLRKGEFDETLAKQIEIKKGVSFYQENVNNAANRFTKEIILNPSTSEANRPLWFSDPSVNILVQFAGYPTVFNNTILKRFVNETYRYPFQVAPKIAMTTLLMTSVALMGNYIRTVGLQQNPERWYRDSPGVRIADAVRRWGGFGPLDYAQRYMEQGERGSGLFATSIKSVTGPAFQDLVDGIQYRKGPFETGINNLPYLNSFIPSEAKKRIAKAGREIDKVLPLLPEKKQIDKKPVKTRKKPYDKGGYVTNVDNASPEPEEKKVRGQPFTYAELGGVLAQDVEDRRGFGAGGKARRQARQAERQAKRAEADNKILPIHMRAYLGSALTRIKKGYTINDLDKEERLALYQFMLPLVEQSPKGSWTYDETEGGYSAVTNPMARRQIQKIKKQGFYLDSEGKKVEVTPDYMDKEFEGMDDPINLIEFAQRQGDPTASIEYFLGGADYITDDRGHIIISDEYDFNIGREGQQPSPQTGKDAGRVETFLSSLIPEKNYLYNILQGVGTLVGPAEGKGAPINLDLGTPEYMREQLQQAGVEGYAEGGRVGFVFGGISRLSKKAIDVIRKHRTKLATEQSEESLYVKDIDNLLDSKNNFSIKQFEQTEEILKNDLKESLGTKDVDRKMRTLYPELYDMYRSDITPIHLLYEKSLLRRTPEREAELEAIRKKGLKKSRVTELEQLSGFGESDIVAQESFLGKDLDVGLVKSKYASKNPPTKKTKEALSKLLDEYKSIGMFDSIDEKEYYLSLYTKKMDGEHWSLPIKITYQRLHSIAKLASKNKEEALDQLHDMIEAASQRFAEGGRVGFASGSIPLTFNQKYHRDTIGMGAVLEERGEPVTVKSIGITHNDLFYNVPSYDRNGGYFTPEEAKKKFLLSIAIGDIQGYKTSKEADIAAQLEHQMMVDESEAALKAVGFSGKTSWQQIGEGFQAGKEALGLDFSEGGLVGEMDRLGLAKGGLQKRRAARQQAIYDKGYSRFMNWTVDQFTPFGMLGGISNLSNVDADRFPRLYNLGVQAGKLYDTAGGATKSALTLRKGKSRYDERGFLKDPDSYETNYDELNDQIQAMSSPEQEGGWFQRLAAKIRANQASGVKRGAGSIMDRSSSSSILAPLAAQAGPQNPTRTVDDYGQVTFGSRGQEEYEQNVREAKAAHRRVQYAAGGTADLDTLLDDLKTAYDSLSPEEESELQRMMDGREGFAEGGESLLKRKIPAHIRNYLKTVLFGDREPITEEVFNKEEYGRVTKGMKQHILDSLEQPRWSDSLTDSETFFDRQGRLRNRVSQEYATKGVFGRRMNPEDIGSFEPHFSYSSKFLPSELTHLIGEARFNLKKGDYNTENLTINSDQYDFAEEFTGKETAPGFNIDNIREYFRLLSRGQGMAAAERFGTRQLPDQSTVARWKEDYGIDREAEFVPVDMSIPVADIFSKDEWDNLQRMEGGEE